MKSILFVLLLLELNMASAISATRASYWCSSVGSAREVKSMDSHCPILGKEEEGCSGGTVGAVEERWQLWKPR